MQYKTLRLQKNLNSKESNPSAVNFFNTHNAGSGLHIRDIAGIGMPELNVNISSTTDNQNSIYNGTRSQNRQIVITAVIRPDYKEGLSVGDIRDSIHRLALPDDSVDGNVRLDFISDDGSIDKYTWGYISKIESPQYAKEPLIQVTIECVPIHILSPVLKAYYPEADTLIANPGGTASSGFQITIRFLKNTRRVTIAKDGVNLFKVWPNSEFITGDTITIDMNPEVMTVVSSRNRENMLDMVTKESKWFRLDPGNQTLRVFGDYSSSATIESVIFRPMYWGV